MKPLSERDSIILALHVSGASLQKIGASLDMKYATVRRIVEHVGPIHAKGRDILSKDPENLEGLRLTGGVSERVYSAIANATYTVDVPDMERLSDVAAQGRECVARFPRIGPGVMAELDAILSRFGIQWNSRARPFAHRTEKNQRPFMKSCAEHQAQREQEQACSEYWSDIVRRVAQIERAVGNSILQSHQGRDSMEGISCRLAFLTGYLESRAEREGTNNMRDITPEDGGYETVGNLICLPGVSLSKVLDHSQGGRP